MRVSLSVGIAPFNCCHAISSMQLFSHHLVLSMTPIPFPLCQYQRHLKVCANDSEKVKQGKKQKQIEDVALDIVLKLAGSEEHFGQETNVFTKKLYVRDA